MFGLFRKQKSGGRERLPFLPAQIIDEGKGRILSEDAPPMFMADPHEQIIALGVFDGLGGSGARIHQTPNGQMSAAAYAARLAQSTVQKTLSKLGFENPAEFLPAVDVHPTRWQGVEDFRTRLHQALTATFKAEADRLEPKAGAVRGSLTRRLPTTACLAIVEADPESSSYSVSAIWAGDSRAYIWTAKSGLLQLSRDHTPFPQDAFGAIRQDLPMNNFVGPDLQFFLDINSCAIDVAFLVLCCTDGAFNYFLSPMEFERAILSCIVDCVDGPLAIDPLREELRQITKDDVSLIITGVGWISWDELLESARHRWNALASIMRPIEEQEQATKAEGLALEAARNAYDASAERLEAARLRGWQEYKNSYESLLPKLGDR